MESLNLPEFKIPDLKQKQLPAVVFYEMIVQNLKSLHESGRLEGILKQPTRRPVNTRFIIDSK